MFLKERAARGGMWLAGLTSVSQAVSWAATIAVANVLNPVDYGLMTMAGFLTAYVEYLSEMGIGAAVIQKHDVNERELSSLFWLSLAVGFVCALAALGLAYPTSLIFREPRIIPVTCLISMNFVIGSVASIPSGILRRDLRLKEIGAASMVSTLVSCACQYLFAISGFGVYTLVLGLMIARLVRTLGVVYFARWLPTLHYAASEVRPYLRFGMGLAGANALFRMYETLDKFIVGRLFGANLLGQYGFAASLANLPMDKVLPVFQQMCYPLLSRLQHDERDRNTTFLQYLKYCLYLTFPLFFAGLCLGDDIVVGLLGDKWRPISWMFRVFCVAKLAELLAEFASILFASSGRSRQILALNAVRLVLMPPAILTACLFGFRYAVVPWATLYPLLCLVWLGYTLRQFRIPRLDVVKALARPMRLGVVFVVSYLLWIEPVKALDFWRGRGVTILGLTLAALLSGVYVVVFDRELVEALLALTKRATPADTEGDSLPVG
jgi:O-antigen/teichoic acid export membrane protein